MDRADRLEELGGLLDRHVEDLGDVLALVVHLERLAVVPRALADLARHVDVGQEVHLDLDRAVARARLAAPALDVEREPPGPVAAHLRLVGGGEELAHVVPHAGVGRRVGPRRAADRRLVDPHQLVEVLDPGDAGVPPRDLAGLVELVGQHRREDVVDQRRLARPRHPGDRDEAAEREGDVDVVQVVLAGADDADLARPVDRTADLRDRDLLAAREVGPGERLGALLEALDRPGVDDTPAVLAGAGADVDHPVRRRGRCPRRARRR